MTTLQQVRSLLASDLDQENIQNLLIHQASVTSELAQARLEYARERAQYINPLKMSPTDWVQLEARTADRKAEVEELEGVISAIKSRIDVGLAWL